MFYASAGRINLIGEHTDYNGGFVFPGAIDKYILAAININGTDKVRAYSADLDDYVEFGLTEADKPSPQWADYVFGVCREIIKRGGTVKGFDTVFAGNVPLGAGLSSSAALESCFAFALNDIFNDNKFDKMELAKIGQATEHNYCGVNCGIMDQFASIFGKKNMLMRLDCRSLEYQYYPYNPVGYKTVLINSKVKHELVDSPYNKRRASCERVARLLGVETLRDATMAMLDGARDKMSDEDYKRALYVIGEKERVLKVCDALERHARRPLAPLRGELRRARLSQRCGQGMWRHGLSHHGRRLWRMHNQFGEGLALRQLHRYGHSQVCRTLWA